MIFSPQYFHSLAMKTTNRHISLLQPHVSLTFVSKGDGATQSHWSSCTNPSRVCLSISCLLCSLSVSELCLEAHPSSSPCLWPWSSLFLLSDAAPLSRPSLMYGADGWTSARVLLFLFTSELCPLPSRYHIHLYNRNKSKPLKTCKPRLSGHSFIPTQWEISWTTSARALNLL